MVLGVDAGDALGDGGDLRRVLGHADQPGVQRGAPAVGAQRQHVVLAGHAVGAGAADRVRAQVQAGDVGALAGRRGADHGVVLAARAVEAERRTGQDVRGVGEHRPQLRDVADARGPLLHAEPGAVRRDLEQLVVVDEDRGPRVEVLDAGRREAIGLDEGLPDEGLGQRVGPGRAGEQDQARPRATALAQDAGLQQQVGGAAGRAERHPFAAGRDRQAFEVVRLVDEQQIDTERVETDRGWLGLVEPRVRGLEGRLAPSQHRVAVPPAPATAHLGLDVVDALSQPRPLDLGLHGQRAEHAVRHDHGVPVAGGAAGGQPGARPRAVLAHDQETSERIGLPELARRLFHQVCRHGDQRLAGQPEATRRQRQHRHRPGLAGADRVRAQRGRRGERAGDDVALPRPEFEAVGQAGQREPFAAGLPGPVAGEAVVVLGDQALGASGVLPEPLGEAFLQRAQPFLRGDRLLDVAAADALAGHAARDEVDHDRRAAVEAVREHLVGAHPAGAEAAGRFLAERDDLPEGGGRQVPDAGATAQHLVDEGLDVTGVDPRCAERDRDLERADHRRLDALRAGRRCGGSARRQRAACRAVVSRARTSPAR